MKLFTMRIQFEYSIKSILSLHILRTRIYLYIIEIKNMQLVSEYLYIGQNLKTDEPTQIPKITRRIQLAYTYMLFKGLFSQEQKSNVLAQCILTYASETSALTKLNLEKLKVT